MLKLFFITINLVNQNINTTIRKLSFIRWNKLFFFFNWSIQDLEERLRNSRTPTWLFRDNDTTHYKVIMIINVNRLYYIQITHIARGDDDDDHFVQVCPRTITFLSILAGQEDTMYKCLNENSSSPFFPPSSLSRHSNKSHSPPFSL